MLGAPSLLALLIPAQKRVLQLGRAALTRAFSASVMQKCVRRSPGTTQVLTCEAKALEIKHCELREALDDEVDLRQWELVEADVKLLESLEL